MKPLSPDTSLEVEEVWLDMQRQRGGAWRLQRAIDMSIFCRRAAEDAVRRAMPDAGPAERELRLLTELYGAELADGFVRRKQELGFYDSGLDDKTA